jgi:hypothetical protein
MYSFRCYYNCKYYNWFKRRQNDYTVVTMFIQTTVQQKDNGF